MAFVIGTAVALPGVAAAQAGPLTDDAHAHVVVDGDTLTDEAQDWLKNYGPDQDAAWTAGDTAGDAAGAAARRQFGKILIGRLLPLAGRVVPIAAGTFTAYEACSAILHPGCWLFQRDDTDIYGAADGPPATPFLFYYPSWDGTASPCDFAGASGACTFSEPMVDVFRTAVFDEAHTGVTPGGGVVNCDQVNAPGPGATLLLSAESGPLACATTTAQGIHARVWVVPAFPDILRPQPDDPNIPNSSWGAPYVDDWPVGVAGQLKAAPNTDVRNRICYFMRPDECLDPAEQKTKDPRCDLPDFGIPTQPVDSFPRDHVFDVFSPVSVPGGVGTTDVNLYWGTPAWGYVHIALEHGWGPGDEEQTHAALTAPTAVVPAARYNSFQYLWFYSGDGAHGVHAHRSRQLLSG